MLFFYNLLQLLLLVLLGPLILAVILLHPKYRRSLPQRFGWNLKNLLRSHGPNSKVIWLHALSVGEVTSALPLVLKIRNITNARIIFSVTTNTGTQLAKGIIAPYVDSVIPFPLDIYPVTRRYIQLIRPDLFILVETDFWPNILFALAHRNIPAALVNGRVSEKSMKSYMRMRFFFKPLFSTFSALCMQTELDRRNMIRLGVDEKRIFTLGNLKYDLPAGEETRVEGDKDIPDSCKIRIVAGSTHKGEEEILLSAFKKLLEIHEGLSFVIAPRDIKRGKEIQHLAKSFGFAASCRSEGRPEHLPPLYVLDIIGELNQFYHTCDVAFVGGSLVEAGGHNPIEPAIIGIPVLFGPHMEDFSEIADDLLAAQGAIRIHDVDSCYQTLQDLLQDPELKNQMGLAAKSCILEKQGVTEKHLELIRKFL